MASIRYNTNMLSFQAIGNGLQLLDIVSEWYLLTYGDPLPPCLLDSPKRVIIAPLTKTEHVEIQTTDPVTSGGGAFPGGANVRLTEGEIFDISTDSDNNINFYYNLAVNNSNYLNFILFY